MIKLKEEVKNRAKQVLFADKLVSPIAFKETLKLESYNMLSQFMDINLDNLKVNIVVEENGVFKINIFVATRTIKPVGIINK